MNLLAEYINKKLSISDMINELNQLITDYNQKTNSYLFIFTTSLSKPNPETFLTQNDYYIIYDLLKGKGVNHKIDFYLETPGGSGEAAEEIVKFLHSEFNNVRFVISGEAKSAGTILALSGDDIYMTETGSLGPIDAQMRIGRSQVSAYDYMDWINERRLEALSGNLNQVDALMIAQITPGEYNGVYNALNFAVDLVEKWLYERKFKDWYVTETNKKPVTDEMKRARAKEIAQELTNHGRWRSHGRSLKSKDLEELGLKINCLEIIPDVKEIIYRIQMICRLIFESSSVFKIYMTADGRIFKNATNIAQNVNEPQQGPSNFEIEIPCPKCNKMLKFVGALEPNVDLTEVLMIKKAIPFPKNDEYKCDCGYVLNIKGIRNDIEQQTGKKIT